MDTPQRPKRDRVGDLAAEPLRSDCAMMRALDLISGKWTVPIVHCLRQTGRMRFRGLQRRLGAVTQKELTRKLRELERAGLVKRYVHAEVPPRVEYELTPLGTTLVNPLAMLACWGHTHGEELDENRRDYDETASSDLG